MDGCRPRLETVFELAAAQRPEARRLAHLTSVAKPRIYFACGSCHPPTEIIGTGTFVDPDEGVDLLY